MWLDGKSVRIEVNGERMVELGFGAIEPQGRRREVATADLTPIAVTGLGAAPRVLDGIGRVALAHGEDVVLRHTRSSRWWYVSADAVRNAVTRALAKRRAIDIDNLAHVVAVEFPGRAADRDGRLERLHPPTP